MKAAAGTSMDLNDAEFKALRKLLEKEQTWGLLAGGKLNEKVHELTVRIAECLPPRGDRTAQDARAAAGAIARGLLEFAVFDLQPEIFHRVVLARLQQISDQASALDKALFRIHEDLYRLVDDARDLFELVSDRLPPGAADLSEIRIYLNTLIDWLNSDPWPQDRRLGGPVLTPATIERKLRMRATGPPHVSEHEQEIDADELARQCSRLVVLGGPGSGKTWLAKRTARLCAEAALDALTAGAGPDEIELPLYTTCARLSAAPPGEGIRRAVVSSALGQLPDLGSTRIVAALQALFEERSAPTLLVADSLDEARDADERIRQADTLSPPWRIVLTSRPASWNRQLTIGDDDPSRRAGVLQPLRYPNDVEPFIAGWFTGRPAWAKGLIAQLRNRPALQQAATVPLILAFYCIVGGDQPLPGRRTTLYARVIRRMLTGQWRGSRDINPDPDACLDTLRDWAWSAAASDPVSGVGTWADEFLTPRVRNQDHRDALDHATAPVGPPDVDTGMTQRHFVHRTIREHLVAEHIAFRMSADQAAGELLKHLWYDPDWEYAAPAALAMHPQHDQVLDKVMRCVTSGDQVHADLISRVDGCWELRRFLARVAQESGERDWSSHVAKLIAQARLDLATSRLADLGQVMDSDWPTSNRSILDLLLGQLPGEPYVWRAEQIAVAVARLDPTPEDRARTRQALLGLLADKANKWKARELAEAIAQLTVTAEDRSEVRQALLAVLADKTNWNARELAEAIAQLTVTAEDRSEVRQALLALLAEEAKSSRARALADTIVRLTVAAEDRVQVRQALLAVLADKTNWNARELAEAIAQLTVTAEDRSEVRQALLALLAEEAKSSRARALADTIVRLTVAAEDRVQVRQALLGVLARQSDLWMARELAEAVARLDPTTEDRVQVRQALLGLLARQSHSWMAHDLAEAAARLDPAPEDRARARNVLLGLLARETFPWIVEELATTADRLTETVRDRAQVRQALLGLLARKPSADVIQELASAVTRLTVTAEDRAQVRQVLLGLLANETNSSKARALANAVAPLGPTPEDRARARNVLLDMLARKPIAGVIQELASAVTRLTVTAEDRVQVRQVLLGLLGRQATTWAARELAELIADLDPTPEDRARARNVLLAMLARPSDVLEVAGLATRASRLAVTAEDQVAVRQVLLGVLARQAIHWGALVESAEVVARLDPTPEERARARNMLLGWLARETHPWIAEAVAEVVARLDPTPEERARARNVLLGLLACETQNQQTRKLADAVVRLTVTAEDQVEVRHALLGLLADEATSSKVQTLADAVARLDPTPEDQAHVRQALLGRLVDEAYFPKTRELANAVVRLTVTAEDRVEVRQALLGLLADEATASKVQTLAETIARLTVTAEDRAQVRQALLSRLATETTPWLADRLAEVVIQLDPTQEDQARTRNVLLDLLAGKIIFFQATKLMGTAARLSPTITDISRSANWPKPPSRELLAAARQNSGASAWLAGLPSLRTGSN